MNSLEDNLSGTDLTVAENLVAESNIARILVANPNGTSRPENWKRRVNLLISALLNKLVEVTGRKDSAYYERNHLVAVLAKIYPSGTKKTAIEGWSSDWHGCVYIDFPWGQGSWHYADSHAHLFEHLPPYQGEWDGTDTDMKYSQIREALSK